MKYFCSKCGKTTQYSFELPKFCAFCGQSFANQPTSAQADNNRIKFLNELKSKKINTVNISNEIDLNEEENLNIDFKNIKAKYKLDLYQPKGESFGNLIDNPSELINDYEIIPSNNSTKTTDEILKEFQSEAGCSRNKE